ncbi:MAG: assimilatory sulfite reductase (NADPH) hemoprotein subunit [Saprospiraceae bacterium]|nr:assimilatory sulfite reductase (NADPH) hemoprotein subunit [Saprospiraceae bacterium]
MENKKVSEVEIIKDKSRYLRGTLVESLHNEITGAVAADDTQLIKFHGSYQQTDRDLDSERKRQKLEPLYSFMIRVRVPGGICTPQQWLNMSDLADKYGNGGLKLTTRQAFQLHGILKRDLQKTIQGFNEVLLDSIAGCGDVNRNVMMNPNPYQTKAHEEVYEHAKQISAHLTPKTSAYWEIWLENQAADTSEPVSPDSEEGKMVAKANDLLTRKVAEDKEPIYGKHYLPRKFKIALAIPPYNDVDIFANDIGLAAIVEDGVLRGYNVAIGGGFGMTFGMPDTYPRLADMIGFCDKDQVVDVCEKVMTLQRDWGNRENRKFSRLKYTIDRVGLDVFKAEVENRLGYKLQPLKPYKFESNGDAYGWSENHNGNWNLTLFVEGGRVKDTPQYKLKTALHKVAMLGTGDFRLTGNQNVMICNIPTSKKGKVQDILSQYGVMRETYKHTALRLSSMACVALNTCSLAFAEAERYLPRLIDKLDAIVRMNGLDNKEIVMRMTGCPNGCGRPYLGEIGLIGRSVGRYNLYLGAAHNGQRLNKLYKEMLNEEEIIAELKPIIEDYAKNRQQGEHFGDFTIRKNYIKPTTHGLNFHD